MRSRPITLLKRCSSRPQIEVGLQSGRENETNIEVGRLAAGLRPLRTAARSIEDRAATRGIRFPIDVRWKDAQRLGLRYQFLAGRRRRNRGRIEVGSPASAKHLLYLEGWAAGRLRPKGAIQDHRSERWQQRISVPQHRTAGSRQMGVKRLSGGHRFEAGLYRANL